MTSRAAVRLIVLVPVVALAAGLILFAHDPPFAVAPLDYLFDAATGVVIAVAGVVAWDRRPGWRTGPLLVLAGYLWYVGSLYVITGPASLVPFIGFAWRGYYDVILAFVVLAVPGDRLRTRLDRAAVWFLLIAMLVTLRLAPRRHPAGRRAWVLAGLAVQSDPAVLRPRPVHRGRRRDLGARRRRALDRRGRRGSPPAAQPAWRSARHRPRADRRGAVGRARRPVRRELVRRRHIRGAGRA